MWRRNCWKRISCRLSTMYSTQYLIKTIKCSISQICYNFTYFQWIRNLSLSNIDIDWLEGFFQHFFNHITAASSPTYVFPDFLDQCSTQYSFQATGCFSIYTVSTLVEDEWRLSNWLISNVRKHVGRGMVRTHNPWNDSSHRYRLSYRCSVPT